MEKKKCFAKDNLTVMYDDKENITNLIKVLCLYDAFILHLMSARCMHYYLYTSTYC